MKLATTLDSLDDLAEDLHENYEQGEDGKFHLTLVKGLVPEKDQDTFEELKGVIEKERNANRETQKQLRDLTTAVEGLGGIEGIKELKDAEAERNRTQLEKKGEWDALRAQMVDEHQGELAKKDETIRGLTERLDREIRGRAIAEAIAAAEGNPNLLQPILLDRAKLVGDPTKGEDLRIEIHDGGTPLVDGDGNLLGVKAYVERLKEDDNFKGAFKGTGNSGGGASGDGAAPGGGSGSGGANGGGIPPELANFRRSTATPQEKVKMLRHLETLHDSQAAIDNAYMALPE